MIESPYRIRPATVADADEIRKTIKITLSNPEGKAVRKSYRDAALRSEILVLDRFDTKDRTWKVAAFVEWHTKIDGSMTIRDIGSLGETPNTGIIKRLLREMLRLQAPNGASLKVRADQPIWNSLLEEMPGFLPEGKEFSRPYWRNIWTWSREVEQAQRPPERGPRRTGPPRRA